MQQFSNSTFVFGLLFPVYPGLQLTLYYHLTWFCRYVLCSLLHPNSFTNLCNSKWIWRNPHSFQLYILHIPSIIAHRHTQIFCLICSFSATTPFASPAISSYLQLSNSHQSKLPKLLVHSLFRNNTNMDLQDFACTTCPSMLRWVLAKILLQLVWVHKWLEKKQTHAVSIISFKAFWHLMYMGCSPLRFPHKNILSHQSVNLPYHI